ncbi:hypothetical protein [Mesorhizobium sp. NZP2077]|uniref:hypothetical protein n=1 Tax=Mesorhizobium sp. NZP2077 TaxID=2483404 RepID=UPI0015546DC6|nr:hypothetical protein [Mesorhizobium sp. NZP2077]QKD18836.1 hypothetical protein HGP13_29470 [Mesorhizobium sp. NZP2077]
MAHDKANEINHDGTLSRIANTIDSATKKDPSCAHLAFTQSRDDRDVCPAGKAVLSWSARGGLVDARVPVEHKSIVLVRSGLVDGSG